MKQQIKYLTIVFSSLCLLFLQTEAQQVLSAKDAVAVAIKNNYDLQLVRNDSISYSIDKSFAKAAFLPQVNASGALLFNNNNQKQVFNDGTVRQSNGVRSNALSGSVFLNWVVFDGFKMFATRDKLDEYVQLGDLNIKNQILNTTSAVLKTYYNIVYEKQQLLAIEEQISINKERRDVAAKKLQVGLGAKPELLQAKVDLNEQEAAKLQQRNNISNLKEQLNQLINVAIATQYEVEDSITNDNEIILGDIMIASDQFNPQLLAIKKNIDISRLILKERRADKYPVVSLNSAYNYNRNNNQTVVNPFSPLNSLNRGFNYGIGVSVPIFNNYTVKRQILQAKLDLDYLDITYKKQQSEIQLAISNAFKTYVLQKQILELEEENILDAKENVFISLQRFRNGLGIYLELREAQKSLADGYRRLFTARYNTKIAEVDLQTLRGEVVEL